MVINQINQRIHHWWRKVCNHNHYKLGETIFYLKGPMIYSNDATCVFASSNRIRSVFRNNIIIENESNISWWAQCSKRLQYHMYPNFWRVQPLKQEFIQYNSTLCHWYLIFFTTIQPFFMADFPIIYVTIALLCLCTMLVIYYCFLFSMRLVQKN